MTEKRGEEAERCADRRAPERRHPDEQEHVPEPLEAAVEARTPQERGARDASSVLPTAMIAALQSGIPVVALTAKAATAIAGQRLRPRRQIAAIATPVGGQTVVATPASASNDRPSRAVAT